ncbi:MAG: hypothetical protein R3C15_15515 [Thermoleophilia bacterium]
MMGLPPIEGGDIVIEIPVGGGGQMIGADADEEPDEDEAGPPAPDDDDEERAPWRLNGHGQLVRAR